MSNQLAIQAPAAPTKPSAIVAMASRLNVEPNKLMGTLKETVFKGASDAELMALIVVANEYGLSPFTKEIYAFPAKGGGIVPVVSVDGWISMMNDHPQMDGIEFEDVHQDGKLFAITCRIFRKDRSRPVTVTEYLSECRRNTEPWKMEHRMLRHKALIQCGRVAFGFSGIYDEDEARDIAGMKIAEAREVRAGGKFLPPTAEPDPEPQADKQAETGDAPEDLNWSAEQEGGAT